MPKTKRLTDIRKTRQQLAGSSTSKVEGEVSQDPSHLVGVGTGLTDDLQHTSLSEQGSGLTDNFSQESFSLDESNAAQGRRGGDLSFQEISEVNQHDNQSSMEKDDDDTRMEEDGDVTSTNEDEKKGKVKETAKVTVTVFTIRT